MHKQHNLGEKAGTYHGLTDRPSLHVMTTPEANLYTGLKSFVSAPALDAASEVRIDHAARVVRDKIAALAPESRQRTLKQLEERFLRTPAQPEILRMGTSGQYIMPGDKNFDDVNGYAQATKLWELCEKNAEARRHIGSPDDRDAFLAWYMGLKPGAMGALHEAMKSYGYLLDERLQPITNRIKSLEEFRAVIEKPVMQRCESSAFHRLLQAMSDQAIIVPGLEDDERARTDLMPIIREALSSYGIQVFVMQHDWAQAFAKAEEFAGGEFDLPYDRCAFEYRYSGRRFIAITNSANDDGPAPTHLYLFMESSVGWALLYGAELHAGSWVFISKVTEAVDSAFLNELTGQIKAVSVALEAEVAATEVIRAPGKLNAKRERAGKPPLYDYHLVSLAHRTRILPREPEPGDLDEKRRTPRLHFRRGHWRQLVNYRVKVKWCLVGDPDLGFVEKEYRL